MPSAFCGILNILTTDFSSLPLENLVFQRFLSRAVSGPQADLGRFRLCETALKQRLAAAGAPETDSAQKPETQTIPSECLRNIRKTRRIPLSI